MDVWVGGWMGRWKNWWLDRGINSWRNGKKEGRKEKNCTLFFPPFLHMLQHSFLLLQSFCKKDGPYYPNLIPDFRNHTDLGNKEYLAYQHL